MSEVNQELMDINHRFVESMSALMNDFNDIGSDKNKSIRDSFKNFKENKGFETGSVFIDQKTKFEQFEYAMFNFMFAIFERDITELSKLAVKQNPKIRKKYLSLFSEYDQRRTQENNKSIRNAEYEIASDEERLKIQIDYFEEVCRFKMSQPYIWQFLADIPDDIFWLDKKLKFEFNEIKERRNLLTHRSDKFDTKYINQLLQNTKTSKNSENPKEIIKEYFSRGLYGEKNRKCDDLKNIVGSSVSIGYMYFVMSWTKLVSLYHIIEIYMFKGEGDFTASLMFECIKLGIKTKVPYFFINNYVFCKFSLSLNKEISNTEAFDYMKANFLLTCVEEEKMIQYYNEKPNQKKIERKIRPDEKEFFEYFSSHNNPLYNFVAAVYKRDFENFETILNKIPDNSLQQSAKDWVLFNDLKEDENLLNLLQTKIKK